MPPGSSESTDRIAKHIHLLKSTPWGEAVAVEPEEWDADYSEFEKLLPPNLHLQQEVGDGNCLFRAVATQIYGDSDRHARVRAEICGAMTADTSLLQPVGGWGAGSAESNITSMSCLGKEGGFPEVLYAQQLYKRAVLVYNVDCSLLRGVLALESLQLFPKFLGGPLLTPHSTVPLPAEGSDPIGLAMSVNMRHWDSILPGVL